jgi:hypothetical protein
MDDSKAEEILERIEVLVPVKQRMAMGQAESSNDAVDRFPNRVATFAERAVVPRGRNSQRLTSTFEQLEVG